MMVNTSAHLSCKSPQRFSPRRACQIPAAHLGTILRRPGDAGSLPDDRQSTRRSFHSSIKHAYIDRVKIDRRTCLEYLGAVALTPVLTGSQEASGMWGLIAKITLLPGRRDEMVEILKESAADMPGCLSYVVAKDATDANTIWVTEVWDSTASHDASLTLPAVKNAIPRGKAIISNFEKIAVTSPVWGAGLPAAHAH